jgi:putative intracellular protease/amidase
VAAILIAPDYDELAVATCVSELREAGVAVTIVSTSAGLIASTHGLTIRPDELIDRRATAPVPRLVIIPGSTGCAETLLADPRVHRLMARTRQAGGAVAVLAGAQAAAAQAGLALTASLVQNERDLPEFLQALLDQFLA